MTRVICTGIKKIAIFDFYSLASTIFNQSALNLAKIYITIRPWMSLIMGLFELERLELFVLELEQLLQLLTNGHQTWSEYT